MTAAVSTFRRDIADGILSMVNTFIAANPSLLVRVYRARPPGLADFPCAYIENRPEDVVHDVQTRTRVMSPSLVVVDRITDNAETMLRMDILVDKLLDQITATPQLVLGTIHNGRMTIADESEDFGDYILAAVRFTWLDISIQEGRGNP